MDFNKRPRHSKKFFIRRLEDENSSCGCYLSLLSDSDKEQKRSLSGKVEIKNELEYFFEQIDLRKIAKTSKLDEDYSVVSR